MSVKVLSFLHTEFAYAYVCTEFEVPQTAPT